MADSGAISSLLGDDQGKSIPIPPPAAAPAAATPQPAPAQPPAAATQAQAQPGFAATPAGEKIAQAESGDRNIPNYAFDQTHTAGGHFQITDTNWKRYAPQVGIDISKYPNAMSAPEQLQGQVAGKMYADMGIMPWSMNPRLATNSLAYDWSKLSPQEQKMMGERSAATNDIVQRLSGLQIEYAREAAAAEPGSKERDALISKYRQNLEEMQSEWRQKVASPPIEKPIDAFANLGSPAVILSLLGGLLSRQHLTAGLNAAGSAMTAINTNNHEQFEKSYQTWKTQTELGLQMINMENQDIRSLLDDKRMAVDEKNARLQTLAAEMGFMGKSGALQLDNIDSASTFVARREQLGMQMQQHMDQIESLNAYRQQTHEDRMAAISARGGGANALTQFGEPPAAQPSGQQGDPNRPPPESHIPQAVWDAATQYVLTGHIPPMGNNAAGRAQILAAEPWVRSARGMSPGDVTSQGIAYAGAVSGERTLGTRLANLNVGLSEVPHLGEQLIKVSDETPRSASMNVNQLLQAFQSRTGDPQIIRLGAALNSYLQSYARAINPTGVISDDMRQHADNILNQAMSKGQIQAGVDQLNQELTAMQQGLHDAAQRGKDMFPMPGERPKGVSEALFNEFSQGGQGIPVPAAHQSDPDGTHYRGSDGKTYVKQGGQMVPVQ